MPEACFGIDLAQQPERAIDQPVIQTSGCYQRRDTTKISDSDCEIIKSIEVDSADDEGMRFAARRRSTRRRRTRTAAEDVEDDELKAAMITLSKIWGKAGKAKTAIGAARAIGKAGKKYGPALDVFTTALTTCSKQDRSSDSDSDDNTTSTTDSDDE